MESNLAALVRFLTQAGVDFILVGGLSGVLNGAPIVTRDVDVVHSREPENIARLSTALDQLEAVYRMQPERKLRPGVGHLDSDAHQNLDTRFGRLDLLGTLGCKRILKYEDLLPRSHAMKIADGLSIRVLDLDLYIELKEELAGEKDLAVLPVLRRTLRERQLRGL